MVNMGRIRAGLALGLAIVAFGCGGDSPTTPDVSTINDSSGSVGNTTTPTPAPAAPAPATGVTVEVLSSTFDPERCTLLTDPRYAGLTELKETARITNNSGGNIYSKPVLFFSPRQTCGAHAENGTGAEDLVSGVTSLDNGKSGETVHTFPLRNRTCGSWQFDNTWRGHTNVFVIGKVINTGVDCPSCEVFDVKVTVTGSGLTRTVRVTFKGLPPGKKATVAFGDGGSAQLGNGESVDHTWGYGSYTVTATVQHSDVPAPCSATAVVSNDPPDACPNIGNPTFSMTKTEAATTGTVVSTLTFPGGFTGSVTLAPNPVSGFSGGAVTSGTPNSSIYNRPESTQSPLTVNGNWQVKKGEQLCKSGSGSVTITPKQRQSCEDYPKPTITGDIAISLGPTQATITSGTVAPGGGSFNPTLPATVNRPPFGQPPTTFSTTYSLPYGPEDLQCKVTKPFSKEVTAREKTCDDLNITLTATKTGETDTTITYTVTANVPGTFNPVQPVTYTKGDADREETVNFTSRELNCPKSIRVQVPHKKTCADYPPPVITLTPNVTTTATQVTVNSITANPGGGTFNPNPPQTYNRPPYGSGPDTKTFTYTLQYNPRDGLQCTARKDVDVRIPPREPTCGEQNPPSASFQGYSDSGGNLSGTVRLQNAGGWTVYMYSTSTEAKCNANQADYEKVKHPVQQACGSSTNDTVTYHWEGHSSEWWWVAWTNSGTPSAGGRSSCKQNTHNPN